MKLVIAKLIFLLPVLNVSLMATYGNIDTIALDSSSSDAVISVPSNAVFKVINYNKSSDSAGAGGEMRVTKDGVVATFSRPQYIEAHSIIMSGSGGVATFPHPTQNPQIAGPATITVTVPTSDTTSVLTYSIRSTENLGSVQTPSNAVVIPSNSSGSVTVILESSVDLLTWTEALPGTYDPSTERRFFRVRAVRD